VCFSPGDGGNAERRLRAPIPPGHECPGYASTEKPGEPGSWRSGSDFGAGFSRLFVSHVARAFMPGRGGRSQSDKAELSERIDRRPERVEIERQPLTAGDLLQ